MPHLNISELPNMTADLMTSPPGDFRENSLKQNESVLHVSMLSTEITFIGGNGAVQSIA